MDRRNERNLVVTQWAWGDEFTYAHDEIATDKRNPTRYANQPIYGVDLANDRGGRDNITVVVVDVVEGASPADLRHLVLRHGMALVAAALLLGFGLSAAASRLLEGLGVLRVGGAR